MAEAGGSTSVEVTDLAIAITGKAGPVRTRVMRDVSDKLLGQFVDCLHHRLAEGQGGAGRRPRSPLPPYPSPRPSPTPSPPAIPDVSAPESTDRARTSGTTPQTPTAPTGASAGRLDRPRRDGAPVLARTYWK